MAIKLKRIIMPGKSKKGGGLESSPVYKKSAAFKLKSGNSQLFKTMGSSPVKQNGDHDQVTKKEQRKSIISDVQDMSKSEIRKYIKDVKRQDSYARESSKYKAPGFFTSSRKKKSWVIAHQLKSQPHATTKEAPKES